MKPVQVLHMKAGDGELSYANNSTTQRKGMFMAKPIRDEAMTKLYHSKKPQRLFIADLGCSSGPNTLLVASQLIEKLNEICQKLENKLPECLVFLNDLPGNDFNAVFKSLPEFQENLIKFLGPDAGKCYFSGVPGSFYGKLLPSKSLHFIHSSYSIHWLSQVPQGLEDNKGNICVATTSPSSVLKAYYQQFQSDFLIFLKCRSEELVEGGRMVLTFFGRKSDNKVKDAVSYGWELLAMTLNQMISEGLIEEEKMDSFSLPFYAPSLDEVRSEVLREGSFAIDCFDVLEIDWDTYEDQSDANNTTFKNTGYDAAKLARAVSESLLIDHFGEEIVDEVYDRYSAIISDQISEENIKFISLTISLINLVK